MKAILKIVNFFSKNEANRPKSKKDANLKYNSTLFFQLSLVISIITVALIINGTYGVQKQDIGNPYPGDHIEEWLGDVIVIKPEEIPVEEVQPEKPVKKVNPTKIIISEKPTEIETVIDTNPDPEVVHVEGPVEIITAPATPVEPDDTKIYSMIGIERVPVFPGCEMFTDNNQRRECMSAEIGKLVSRRFNTEIAGEVGLQGNQRIYVSFVIDKKGELTQLQVRAPHPRLEREAERVVKMIPKMLPGIQNNREVDVMFTLPIIFNVVN